MADEGGLAGGLATNESALALVTDGIGRAGLVPGEQVALAIDIAANQIFDAPATGSVSKAAPLARPSGCQSWRAGASGTPLSRWKTCSPKTTGRVGAKPAR